MKTSEIQFGASPYRRPVCYCLQCEDASPIANSPDNGIEGYELVDDTDW